MKLRTLAAIAIAGAATPTLAGPAAASLASDSAERRAAQHTERFLRACERRDVTTVAALLHPRVTLIHPITFSGALQPEARFTGKPQVLGYLRTVFQVMDRIQFTDERVSVARRGRTTFAQANGNFTTADGRPYRNVYLFRFDWRNGRIVGGEEYYNPVTFSQTFGTPLG
jgi:ketosteroid isomerase-like protein